MKKWMTLLLCCLLCWCAAGAMAEEPVTLDLTGGYVYQIYPDGYQKGKRNIWNNEFEPEEDFKSYTGPYVVKGESNRVDTCLDFYSIPYKAPQNTEPVTYTVTFEDVVIEAGTWATAIRFGEGEGKEGKVARAKDITLNLINIRTNNVKSGLNHAVFSNQGKKSVVINLHNAKGASLEYNAQALYNENVTLNIEGTTVTSDNVTKYVSPINNTGTLKLEEQKKAPTCTEAGNKGYYSCTCGMWFSDAEGKNQITGDVVIEKLGHELTLEPAKAATCTEEGNIEYYRCTRDGCGAKFFDAQGKNQITGDVVIEKLGHKLTPEPAKAPTCTVKGYQAHYECSNCHNLFEDADGLNETTLEALTLPAQHDLEKVPAKAATCTEDGNKECWKCTREGCGKLFTDKDGKTETTLNDVRIPATHKLTFVPKVPSTCTEKGYEEHWVCTDCHKLFEKPDDDDETALELLQLVLATHKLTFVPEVPSTCTEKGYEEHWVCTDCHKLFDDPKDTIETSLELLQLDLAPHKLTFVPEVPSTCTEKGYEEHWVCSDCHKLFEKPDDDVETSLELLQLDLAPHKLTFVPEVPSTCTEKGYEAHWVCTDCHKLFEKPDDDVETALELLQLDLAPHKLTFVPEKPATTTEDGRAAHYACTVCDRLFTDVAGQNETTLDALILPVLVRTDDLPQTGDSSRLTGWLSLLGACCAGLWRLNSRRA